MKRLIRRRWLITAALGVVALGAYCLWLPRHRIDEAHFKLIEKGMTYAEVEAIFGVPPGEYDWAQIDEEQALLSFFQAQCLSDTQITLAVGSNSIRVFDGVQREEYLSRTKSWTSRHGEISVVFDAQRRVESCYSHNHVRIVPPWQRFWATLKGQ